MNVSQNVVQYVVIGLGIVAGILTSSAVILGIRKRKNRKEDEALEERVVAAEQARLDTLMQFLTTHRKIDTQSSTKMAVAPPTLWAFEPAQYPSQVCQHGAPILPPQYVSLPGYQAAFVDTCPICYPQNTLAQHDIVTYDQLDLSSGAYPVAPLPPQAMFSPTPTHMNLPAQELRTSRHISRARIRRARTPHEMPRGPPPEAPPGFVAVPMIIEGQK